MRAGLTIAMLAFSIVVSAATEGDESGLIDIGIGTDGNSVVVEGDQRQGGESGSDRSGRECDGWSEHAPGAEGDGDDSSASPADYEECYTRWDPQVCWGEPADSGMPVVTIGDVARFVPASTVLAGEPFNRGVAGLPTNFVADAAVAVTQGELFGRSVSVEFTPVRFDFDYGDGEAASTTSGGTPWESVNAPQFTPTDTSHAYRERGTYTASVTVTYAARVDLGAGWIPLNGTVTGPPAAQSIRIYEARSALVSKTCDQNPDGIGC